MANDSPIKMDVICFPELKIVELETFTPCNRKCSYCPNSTNKRLPHYLSMETIEKIVSDLKQMGFSGQFSFQFYNEPLLDKRMPEIVELVRVKLPKAFLLMYTNGDYLTYKYFRLLIDKGIDKFLVTRHEQSINKHNLSWRFSLKEKEKQYLFYQSYRNPEIFYTNRGGILPHIEEINSPLTVPCALPSTSMTITAKGNVVLCFEDYHESQIMGNVMKSSIQEIWYGEKFRQVRRLLIDGDRTCTSICRKCNNIENQEIEEVNYTQRRVQNSN